MTFRLLPRHPSTPCPLYPTAPVSCHDTATVTGNTVVVGAGGHLGVLASSKRFKQEIAPMDKASEAILALTQVELNKPARQMVVNNQ